MTVILKSYFPDAIYDGISSHESFKGFCHDTRHLNPGELFLAFQGEKTHGVNYAVEAYNKGALAVVVEESHACHVDGPKIIVKDVFKAAYEAARLKRARYEHKIAAVTGTAGKTSSKEYFAQLAPPEETYVSFANWNNLLGLVVNLSRLSLDAKFVLFELGISNIGDMDELVDLLRPEIAAIVTIGTAHLDGLGSLHYVAKEKQKITRYATILLTTQQAFPFLDKTKDWIIVDQPPLKKNVMIGSDDLLHAQVDLYDKIFNIKANGLFYLPQFCLAIAMLAHQGHPLDSIKNDIKLTIPKGRASFLPCGTHVFIDDTYNANPVSLNGLLCQLQFFEERSLVVLGDFAELGDQGLDLLKQTLEPFSFSDRTECVYWGKDRAAIQSLGIKCFDHYSVLIDYIRFKNPKYIALKGSRSSKMERVLEKLFVALSASSPSMGVLGQGMTGKSIIEYAKKNNIHTEVWSQECVCEQDKEQSLQSWIDRNQILSISPGVCPHLPPYTLIPKEKVISDLDIFFNRLKTKNIIAITGTNGKTSLVELMTTVIKANGLQAWACGNNETPPLALLDMIGAKDWVVCELSSFQLYWMSHIPKVTVAAITSFDQDHLNWHQTLEEYHACKESLLLYADHRFAPTAFTSLSKCLVWDKSFLEDQSGEGFYDHGLRIAELSTHLVRSPLRHPLHQAWQIAATLGFDREITLKTLLDWQPSPHRFERRLSGDILWINDTKATNVEAALAALQSISSENKSIYVVMGGEGKGQNFSTLEYFYPLADKFFLIGKAASEMAIFLREKAYCVATIEGFFEHINNYPKPNVVLLSPACASVDQFKNYKERGDVFFRLVKEWEERSLEAQK